MKSVRARASAILCAGIFIISGARVFAAPHNQATNAQKSQAAPAAQESQQVPSINGNIGACTAEFTVRDGQKKPIYNAQITVQLRYGFFSLRKTDLQVGTNSDGKARFTGLPNFPKKPLAFHIKSGTVSKTVTDDPSTNCNAVFDVTLSVH